jgi:hypothetical protein
MNSAAFASQLTSRGPGRQERQMQLHNALRTTASEEVGSLGHSIMLTFESIIAGLAALAMLGFVISLAVAFF